MKKIAFLILAFIMMVVQARAVDRLNEGFEGGAVPPPGWTLYTSAGGSGSWHICSGECGDHYTTPHSGSYMAWIDDVRRSQDEWLITPKLDLTQSSGPDTLTFWWYQWFGGNPHFSVLASFVDNEPSSFTTTLFDTNQILWPQVWTQEIIDLTDYEDFSCVYIAFRYQGNYQWELFLDDVSGPSLADTTPQHDVGIKAILDSGYYLPLGSEVGMEAVIKNYGGFNEENFWVRCRIVDGSGSELYVDSLLVASLPEGASDSLSFASWVPVSCGVDTVVVTTLLNMDENPYNNRKSHLVKVVTDRVSPWPAFLHDEQHTGRSPYRGAKSPHQAWAHLFPDGIWASPVIGEDGTIYFGCRDGNFYALSHDGSERWHYSSGEEIRGGAAIGPNGGIYFGSHTNFLYALDSEGNPKWSKNLGGNVDCSPVVDPLDGTIYCGSSTAKLFGFTPNGANKPGFPLDLLGSIYTSHPAIGPTGTVYFGTMNNHYFYAVDPNGAVKWKYRCDRGISSGASVKGNTVYFTANDGKLYSLRDAGSDYEFLWSTQIGRPKDWVTDVYYSTPAVGPDGTIFVGTPYDTLVAVTPDGTIKWKFDTGGRVWSSAAIDVDGVIYFGSYDGNLYALEDSLTYARIKWVYAVGDGIRSSVAVDRDGTIYFGCNDGNLYAISPLPDTGGINSIDQIKPKRFSLSQNYPNPFNSSTLIRYHLSAVGRPQTAVTLQVYNILGEEVRSLVDSKQKPGEHQVVWDGRDNSGKPVASGVYICRLKAESRKLKAEKTRKMVLLR